jgi:hypothetical protein
VIFSEISSVARDPYSNNSFGVTHQHQEQCKGSESKIIRAFSSAFRADCLQLLILVTQVRQDFRKRYFVITPQAILSPEFPEGSVF